MEVVEDEFRREQGDPIQCNVYIAILDEIGESGAGSCEGRHNALVTVATPLLLTEFFGQVRAHVAHRASRWPGADAPGFPASPHAPTQR